MNHSKNKTKQLNTILISSCILLLQLYLQGNPAYNSLIPLQQFIMRFIQIVYKKL